METADLMDQFKAKARPEGEQMRILDKDGKVFLDIKRADKGEAQPRGRRLIEPTFMPFWWGLLRKGRFSGAGSSLGLR